MTGRRGWFLGITSALLGGVAPLASQQSGAQLFQTKCAACHSLASDRMVGPGLRGVTARRQRAWLVRWIAMPNELLSAGDPIARQLLQEYGGLPMPNLGLTEREAESVIAYLETAAETGTAPSAAAAPLPAGKPIVGKGLFTGATRFHNGGPSCMACHSIAGIGALGGGALGPDLTAASRKYGVAGLAAVLATTPFPTMQPIFAPRSLTPEEQAHLAAFLVQASVSGRSPRAVGLLMGAAVVATLMLFGLVHLAWRGRLTTVRRQMVESARSAFDPQRASDR